MRWITILTMLTLAVTSASLVFFQGMEPWQAFLIVCFTTVGILLVLFSVLWIFIEKKDRPRFLHLIKVTFWADLDPVLKYFKIRK